MKHNGTQIFWLQLNAPWLQIEYSNIFKRKSRKGQMLKVWTMISYFISLSNNRTLHVCL